jgi:hypothetical protein
MSDQELGQQTQRGSLSAAGWGGQMPQPTRTTSGVKPTSDAAYASFLLRIQPDRRAAVSDTYQGRERRRRT